MEEQYKCYLYPYYDQIKNLIILPIPEGSGVSFSFKPTIGLDVLSREYPEAKGFQIEEIRDFEFEEDVFWETQFDGKGNSIF